MSTPKQFPLTSFGFSYDNGKLTVLLDGQPVELHLLQKVEVVIDAQLQAPFVRLTMLAGKTGVKLGNTTLEIKPGDPAKPTFEGPQDAHEYDNNHGHDCFNDSPAP